MTVILVKKRSVWEQYHANQDGFGRIEPESLARMKASHDRHTRSVEIVLEALHKLRVKPWIIEGAETRFKAFPGDVVLAVGGDGTLLAASHNIGPRVGVMAINSDPEFSRGRFCNVVTHLNVASVLKKVLKKNPAKTMIPRMAVRIDGQEVATRVLNEALYSHTCPAAMTRVMLGKTRYACSGLWIGTGAGSTGAIKSAGGMVLPLRSPLLQTIVREPCGEGISGLISILKHKFEFVSKTPDATLYIDGPFLRVPVHFDQTMSFERSKEPLMMLGPVPR